MPERIAHSNSQSVISDDFILLTGRSNPKLAHAIGKLLNSTVYEPIDAFSDGEIRVRIQPNLRRRFVFIIQPTAPPVNDSIMELIFMIDAARRASAREIITIIPYFGYSRQDRKEMPRVPISASAVARMIDRGGADRIVTVDIHAEQEEGFTAKPWDNLYGDYSLVPQVKKLGLKNVVVASPDKNGMSRAAAYARFLQARGIAVVYKERDIDINNKSDVLDMIGKVADSDVILVDDMIDTGGTIVNAANFLKQRGAKSVRAVTTHGLFTGPAIERINKSAIEEVIVTDSINLPEHIATNPKITVVSIAQLLAEAIRRIQSGESLTKDLFLNSH